MKIAIIDFKSDFTLVIEERLKELNVAYDKFENTVKKEELNNYAGMILTGSHDTVYAGGKVMDKDILDMGKPVLGICYGMQLVHYMLGGEVEKSNTPEVGAYEINIVTGDIFKGLPTKQKVMMYHNDHVTKLAPGFVRCASTTTCENAASENKEKKIYTTQFHPELKENDYGKEIFINFLNICKEN